MLGTAFRTSELYLRRSYKEFPHHPVMCGLRGMLEFVAAMPNLYNDYCFIEGNLYKFYLY